MPLYELSQEEWEIIMQARLDKRYKEGFNGGLEKACAIAATYRDSKTASIDGIIEMILKDRYPNY